MEAAVSYEISFLTSLRNDVEDFNGDLYGIAGRARKRLRCEPKEGLVTALADFQEAHQAMMNCRSSKLDRSFKEIKQRTLDWLAKRQEALEGLSSATTSTSLSDLLSSIDERYGTSASSSRTTSD